METWLAIILIFLLLLLFFLHFSDFGVYLLYNNHNLSSVQQSAKLKFPLRWQQPTKKNFFSDVGEWIGNNLSVNMSLDPFPVTWRFIQDVIVVSLVLGKGRAVGGRGMESRCSFCMYPKCTKTVMLACKIPLNTIICFISHTHILSIITWFSLFFSFFCYYIKIGK